MAANFWAQMHAIAGWLGLGVGIPIYVILLGIGSWFLKATKGAVIALVAVVFTLLAFYIHRNDLLFMLILLRRSLMVWVVLVIPGMLLIDARRARSNADTTVASS
jgi:hypothetical protein